MEWSINAEDEFAEHSSFDPNKDGTIEGDTEGEGEGEGEGNAEWRQKLETLPTIESIDVTNMTRSFNREIIQGRNTSHQFARSKDMPPLSFLSPRGMGSNSFTEEVARWELDGVNGGPKLQSITS